MNCGESTLSKATKAVDRGRRVADEPLGRRPARARTRPRRASSAATSSTVCATPSARGSEPARFCEPWLVITSRWSPPTWCAASRNAEPRLSICSGRDAWRWTLSQSPCGAIAANGTTKTATRRGGDRPGRRAPRAGRACARRRRRRAGRSPPGRASRRSASAEQREAAALPPGEHRRERRRRRARPARGRSGRSAPSRARAARARRSRARPPAAPRQRRARRARGHRQQRPPASRPSSTWNCRW